MVGASGDHLRDHASRRHLLRADERQVVVHRQEDVEQQVQSATTATALSNETSKATCAGSGQTRKYSVEKGKLEPTHFQLNKNHNFLTSKTSNFLNLKI